MSEQVWEFFLQYEDANRSSDTSAIGELYASTFMFGGPNGVHAVQREDFLRLIPKMKAHLSSLGLVESQLRSVEANQISSRYLLANVGWRMSTQSPSGSRHVDAIASYVLSRGTDDELSIVFQIDHQDLATAIQYQQNGGLPHSGTSE